MLTETTTANYTTQFLDNGYPDIEDLTRSGEDTVRDFSVRYIVILSFKHIFFSYSAYYIVY